MINDSSFKELMHYKKYKDLYDKNSIEGVVSKYGAVLFTLIICILINKVDIEDTNTIIRSLTKDIAISLIGLLGFVVTGLAILTSAISNKLMNILYQKGKVEHIKKILLSFYLLSISIGICIVLNLLLYVISFFYIDINIYLFILVTLVCSYLLIFIIFYSIALVGNCVQIFTIINMPIIEKDDLSKEEKAIFESLRITTIEKILLLIDDLDSKQRLEMYRTTMIELIDGKFQDEIKRARIKKYLYEHIGKDNDK